MKLIGAFLAGAFAMWLLMQLLDNETPRPAATSSYKRTNPPTTAVTAGQNAQRDKQNDGQTTAMRGDIDDSPPPSATPVNPPPSAAAEDTPDPAFDQSQGRAVADEPDGLATIERLNNVPPMDTPIPVEMSPQHADVAERTPAINELHSALESEPEDIAWAYEMQNNIQAFLLQSEPMQDFGSASVHCRTALCEIQAIGYAPGGGQTQWSVVLGQMRLQPWFRNFAKSHGYSSGIGDQTVIFTFLERNPATLDQSG